MNRGPDSTGLSSSLFTKVLPIILALLSFAASVYYNEANLRILHHEAPEKLEPRYGWVQTADDISYLRPAENYYHKGVWRDNNPGLQAYFLRTPGYGLFRYVLMLIFGLEKSYHYFVYVQVLLFSISVWLLFQLALLCGLNFWVAVFLCFVYGLTPFASGFLYYSLTEGISPALLIAYAYFLLLARQNQQKFYFYMAALIMACIGLTRPVLLLFGAALPVAISGQKQKPFAGSFLTLVATAFIALAPLGFWALRSTLIAGFYPGIYPIYFLQNNSQYRPTHAAIWQFQKSYGTEGRDFHELMVPLWKATMNGDTADVHIDSILNDCPPFVKAEIGEARLRNSYTLYRQSIIYQRNNYPRGMPMPDTIPNLESQVVHDFKGYAQQMSRRHWFWCQVLVPLRLFRSLALHSNLSLYMFQHTYRGKWWMEGMRACFLLLHSLCCISFFFMLRGRNKPEMMLLGLCMAAYLFYLCYFFRGLEERYTLPVLPLMLLALAIAVSRAFRFEKARE